MQYVSVDQLEQFEFHDSTWKLICREGDDVTFSVENLNIHKDTAQNDEEWDMELAPARMTFRGFRLICFEPGRSWTTDENGVSVPVGERVLHTGEEGMSRLAEDAFQVLHFEREGDHWEFGGCGAEPYFTVELAFDSVEIAWESYAKKAWYELHRYYSHLVTLDTPDGLVQEKLEIMVHEEDTWCVKEKRLIPAPSVSAGVRCMETQYWGRGRDDDLWIDAIADLQKKLPGDVTIRSCLTCRHGNLCPHGTQPGKVYCLKGEKVSCKMDVAALCDDGDSWMKREKGFFDTCEDWAQTSVDRYTYNDYESYLNQ